MGTGNLVWLASYPKSGNTWIRILLANYKHAKNEPVDINLLDSSIISSSRVLFDTYSPLASSDLTFEEIDILRPKVYQAYQKELNHVQIIKTHDAYTFNAHSKPIFPEKATKGVIHVVRNPLDVAVSFAFHMGVDFDKAIADMQNPNKLLAGKKNKLNQQLRQILLSWSQHFETWNHCGMPYLLVRYEDLKTDTHNELIRIVNFLYGSCDLGLIDKAVEHSRFERIKAIEEEKGFKEKPVAAERFFRKGEVKDYLNHLTEEQIQTVCKGHKSVREQLRYNLI